jgi:peptidoglycan/xylan/chitin deacetylase (PgdA/CDA1 family)
MRIPGLKAARISARWLRSRFAAAGVVVLGYHRVAEPEDDPFELCVSPEHFAQQLEVIGRLATPVRVPGLVGHGGDDLPARAVAITFDDGYADVLATALPLLRRHGIPATVFVVAGSIGTGFWWDRMAGALSSGNGDSDRAATELHGMHLRLRGLPSTDRERELCRLGAGAQGFAVGPARCLTAEELRELAADPLVDIGAHTCTHPWLPALPEPERKWEVERCKRDLEEITGHAVSAFSYPHGGMSPTLRQEVRSAGYSLACCSRNDVWLRGADPFSMPRFWVPDQDGAEFERWLRRWLCG